MNSICMIRCPDTIQSWAQNAEWLFSIQKCKESATEFLCVNTVSDKVVTCKAFTGLSIRAEMVRVGRPLLRENLAETDFQSLFALSASAVTPSEKVKLT